MVPTEKRAICAAFAEPSDGLEPSTPSLPWKSGGGTGVHARSFAVTFVLQIGRWRCAASVRECPGVLRWCTRLVPAGRCLFLQQRTEGDACVRSCCSP